ncbi:hypothetical protein EV702DRAFT_119104 [Suillus placidus]|uniref:DUF6533 domain-containing protein n=1 Tax=Suillus placidus TaxID=48579 RepID=A0A9P7D4E6_9AGAM|nr:hypothetical protein EV702DRAFT_119104 [Suillus placidus]
MMVYLAVTRTPSYINTLSSLLAHTHPSNMTFVSNDPSWWPFINSARFLSYILVSASTVVIYDCVLTLGQEIELIWRQRWSLMTVLYLSIRYIGTIYIVTYILDSPTVSLSDAVSNDIEITQSWVNVVVTAMMGVIMIARLHALYQGSRKMLIFLIVIFLAVNIACIVLTTIGIKFIVGEEVILSNTYACGYNYEGDVELLITMVWILGTAWEVLALFLSVWIAVGHFRDMRQFRSSTGSIVEDCFTVMIKSHLLYFASFTTVACLQLGHISPAILDSNSVGTEIYTGILQISLIVQMFVLGPRLILSVREYNARLVTDSDAGTHMTSIAFQERVHVSTSSTV